MSDDNKTEAFRVYSLQEILENVDPASTAESEGSYRRGYVQGYFTAISDRNKGFDIEQQLEHIETLMNWRYQKQQEFLLPPELSRKE
jgi:hypothetical protein